MTRSAGEVMNCAGAEDGGVGAERSANLEHGHIASMSRRRRSVASVPPRRRRPWKAAAERFGSPAKQGVKPRHVDRLRRMRLLVFMRHFAGTPGSRTWFL